MSEFKFVRDSVGVLSGESMIDQIENAFTDVRDVVDSAQNAVRVDQVQDFTSAQQEQGRENIGIESLTQFEVDEILDAYIDVPVEPEDESETSAS